jgi:hypothetical protein
MATNEYATTHIRAMPADPEAQDQLETTVRLTSRLTRATAAEFPILPRA